MVNFSSYVRKIRVTSFCNTYRNVNILKMKFIYAKEDEIMHARVAPTVVQK